MLRISLPVAVDVSTLSLPIGSITRPAPLASICSNKSPMWDTDLKGPKLSEANPFGADLNYANMQNEIFCNTTTPNCSVIYKGC
jgi:hypothetical protein